MASESDFGTVQGAGAERTYMTRPGDTLEAIAAYFYGSEEHRSRLVEENPDFASTAPGDTLPAGTTLRVSFDPDRGDTVEMR